MLTEASQLEVAVCKFWAVVQCNGSHVQAQNGASALHNAASGGHLAVVHALLAAKADRDIQNSNGNTALHLAASRGASMILCQLAPQACSFMLVGEPRSFCSWTYLWPISSGPWSI